MNGNTPSKKNSKQIVYVRGRPLIISSKKHKDWHSIALESLKLSCIKQNIHKMTLTTTSDIILTFYAENRRKFDLTNKAESIMDILVDVGLLEDDNYEVVPNLTLKFGGLDKNNPRCEIEIL